MLICKAILRLAMETLFKHKDLLCMKAVGALFLVAIFSSFLCGNIPAKAHALATRGLVIFARNHWHGRARRAHQAETKNKKRSQRTCRLRSLLSLIYSAILYSS